MSEEGGSFEVNGKRYSLVTSLTMGEMCDAEQFFGVTFGDANAGTSLRMAAALMFISIRREDPTVTVEDIRDLPIEVFESFVAAGDALPPAVGSNGQNGSSGELSTPNGDDPEDHLATIGDRGWPIGSDSDLLTSKT